MNDKNIIQMPDVLSETKHLCSSLFCYPAYSFMGMCAALNDILITQFKSVFALSNFASALVQSAFYGGYF